MDQQYGVSDLEARAVMWKFGVPVAVWIKGRLAAVVSDYQAASQPDVATLREKLASATPSQIAAIKTILSP